MARRVAAVDWDDTLVDAKTQEWLPEAEAAIRTLLARYHTVIIHTCRANWPEGLASIEAKVAGSIPEPWLAERIQIVGKPQADAYIDNLAVRYTGNWTATLACLPAAEPARHTRSAIPVVAAAPIALRQSFARFSGRA